MPRLTDTVYHNPDAQHFTYEGNINHSEIRSFHQNLTGYKATPLTSCNKIAQELGIQSLFVKDESSRLGLPAFKILGASWACYKVIAQRLGLKPQASLESLKQAIKENLPSLRLHAATDGNHGRALARMSNILNISSVIYVPGALEKETMDLIRNEGAEVHVLQDDYDTVIQYARRQADSTADGMGLFIQDTAFDGYEEIPEWIVDGYSTMMEEADEQMISAVGQIADIVVTPVGVGSLATAVVSHYKSLKSKARVIAVEPEAADCLFTALLEGVPKPIKTGQTIMSGMNCGTVSSIAWPLLKTGVDASVRITDSESHAALLHLQQSGVEVGPCGSAALAALIMLAKHSLGHIVGLGSSSRVLLLSTEGSRKYTMR